MDLWGRNLTAVMNQLAHFVNASLCTLHLDYNAPALEYTTTNWSANQTQPAPTGKHFSNPEIQPGNSTTHNSRFPDLNTTGSLSITILILEHFIDDHHGYLFNLPEHSRAQRTPFFSIYSRTISEISPNRSRRSYLLNECYISTKSIILITHQYIYIHKLANRTWRYPAFCDH